MVSGRHHLEKAGPLRLGYLADYMGTRRLAVNEGLGIEVQQSLIECIVGLTALTAAVLDATCPSSGGDMPFDRCACQPIDEHYDSRPFGERPRRAYDYSPSRTKQSQQQPNRPVAADGLSRRG